jgi:ABC-type branched-subunit amino acid transport system substrate-binding protein
MFLDLAAAAGGDGNGPYRPESYDAAALIALAMQAAGSADRAALQGKLMEVANAKTTCGKRSPSPSKAASPSTRSTARR